MLRLKVSLYKRRRLHRSLSTAINFQNHDLPQHAEKQVLDFFDSLLRTCNSTKPCREIHSQILVTGSHRSPFLASRLVAVYSNFGTVSESKRVFDAFPVENLSSNRLLWNAIIRAHVSHGFYEKALQLFDEMLRLGVFPDGFTFPLAVKACSFIGDFGTCKTTHGHVIKMGYQNNLHSANELIGMYGKLGRMNEVRKVFERMPSRSQVSWNTIISGFAFNQDCDGARETFSRMGSGGFEPNPVTWTSLLSSHARCGRFDDCVEIFGSMTRSVGPTAESLAVMLSVCADSDFSSAGKTIHGYLIKGGFERYSFAKNALINMYGKSGDIYSAERSFSEMAAGTKTLVSWNAMISSYSESGLCDEAFELFTKMTKNSYNPRPNIVTWSAIIAGFASTGRTLEALDLFRAMQAKRVTANSVTVCTVLSACAESAALRLGREVHGHAIRAEIHKTTLVGNALINMYAKSGSLKECNFVFEGNDNKDMVTWNSMISAYGTHGLGREALRIFDRMTKSGLDPDDVTFVSVLSACSHSGLVSKGRSAFKTIPNPRAEHYACLVDLLGRAGLFDEAGQVAKKIKPNSFVWTALLNGRVKEGIPEGLGSGGFALLSNIYAAEGKWEESAGIRVSARSKGVKKTPGLSWIQIKNEVHAFSAGDFNGSDRLTRVLQDLHGLDIDDVDMDNGYRD